jgi:hypothetical protein
LFLVKEEIEEKNPGKQTKRKRKRPLPDREGVGKPKNKTKYNITKQKHNKNDDRMMDGWRDWKIIN